jgi:predicted component of type VI protein secretion system
MTYKSKKQKKQKVTTIFKIGTDLQCKWVLKDKDKNLSALEVLNLKNI